MIQLSVPTETHSQHWHKGDSWHSLDCCLAFSVTLSSVPSGNCSREITLSLPG